MLKKDATFGIRKLYVVTTSRRKAEKAKIFSYISLVGAGFKTEQIFALIYLLICSSSIWITCFPKTSFVSINVSSIYEQKNDKFSMPALPALSAPAVSILCYHRDFSWAIS